MKKIKTISTLVAGLGIAFLGHTTHADAAENNNQQQSTYNYSTTEVSFSNSGNLYTSGQCTWYVYHRMNQFDASISGDLGDAHNWNNRAESEGYTVTHTPKNHTAVVFEAGQLGADTQYGHVAFVEKVNDDGSIVISESNVKGLGVISFRTIDAEDAQDLDYIKGK